MTRAAAEKYRDDHAATIKADMAAKRAAAQAELHGKLIPYPRHVEVDAGTKIVETGNAPEWVQEKVAVKMAAIKAPNRSGITVEIDSTDYTGGRDENGQRVDDGHGAIIRIKTDVGALSVHEGYHRGGSSDKWEDEA